MYQATGNSRSCAKTAMPRPHRLPVHNAHPAASTPAPMIANQAAVPYPLSGWSLGTADGPHEQHHGHHDQRGALERHHDARLAHGCRVRERSRRPA